jgi:hypothetical protein
MTRKLSVLVAILAAAALSAAPALAASSPAVVTGSVTNVADTSAKLLGTVNPNGSATTYLFQWGLTNAYGVNGFNHPAGSGIKTVSVSATPTGLTPGTVYHYRVVATNKDGTSVGADRAFKTSGFPPAGVATGAATDIGPFSVALTGVVNPNGEATTWLFQYGVTSSLGSATFGQPLAASSAPTTISQPLFGLEPGTTFYYRLVALHDLTVVSYGAEAAFMTEPYPRPFPGVTALTTPHKDKKKPFTFTTFGTVSGQYPADLQCTGTATIRYLLGRKQVASTVAALQPNCTFSGQVVFRHLPGRGSPRRQVDLRVLILFNGNGYLAPKSARAEQVVLG